MIVALAAEETSLSEGHRVLRTGPKHFTGLWLEHGSAAHPRCFKWTAGTRKVSGKTVPWLSKTVSAEGVSYSILAGSVSGVTYPSIKALPATKAGALWNFMFIEHDMSEGVHNYQYAKALLDASIAELKK